MPEASLGAKRPHVAIRGVTKRFQVGDGEIDALGRIDAGIEASAFVCLIGASGCGKSTLLRIVAGFEEPTTGGIAAGNATNCDSEVTATASGLLVIGRVVATKDTPNGGAFIQGFDAASGKFLWQIPVLLNGQATPAIPRLSTYSVNGKQYIVSFMHSAALGADVTAFALP